MLPLVQMHHVVHQPPPPPPNPFALPDRNDFGYFPEQRNATASRLCFADSPFQRAFPIRTSNSAQYSHHRQTAAPLPFSLNGLEHQLRRKTPNGTLDAGYDGSLAQLAPGPPPSKHMILSASPPVPAASGPDLDIGQHAGDLLQLTPGATANGIFHESQIESLGAALAIPTSQPITPFPLEQHRPQLAFHTSYVSPEPKYTPNAGFASSSAYGSDSVPRTDLVGHLVTHGYVSTPLHVGNHGYGHPNYFPHSHDPHHDQALLCPVQQRDTRATISGMGFSGPDSQGAWQRAPRSMPNLDFGDASLQLPFSQVTACGPFTPFENLGSELGRSTQPPVVSSRFREKALAQAHRAYRDLLTYLHHTRKSHQATRGLASLSKLLVYPKTPRQSTAETSTSSNHAISAQTSDLIPGKAPPQSGYLGRPPTSYVRPSQSNCHAYVKAHSSAYTSSNPPILMPSACPSVIEASPSDPVSSAKHSLDMLTNMCEQSGWKWVDAILLGGCLLYGLDRYEEALGWFTRVTELDANHVEAISNTAAALYCLDRSDEAERCWFRAIHVQPRALESAEHLVGLLYKKRSREAIDVIDYVQRSLRFPAGGRSRSDCSTLGRSSTGAVTGDLLQTGPDHRLAGFGSSGYAIPASENGRMLTLVHAKGTMLYALQDIEKASRCFEEAVLISAGRQVDGIQQLVRRIHLVLCPRSEEGAPLGRPLLLPPEKARLTARLVFSGEGELPGLRHVRDGGPRRAAVQTTSNALLSLAKIFQDAISSSNVKTNFLQWPSGVDDILALYYLSLSLQESPSTANNVGILLASVQQSTSATTQPSFPDAQHQSGIPGIASGSGLAMALAYYKYGLALDPKHVHLHTNLGSLLKDIGQLDLAIQMYEKAVMCDGSFDIALTNLANAVKDRGRVSDAIAYYKRAVNANPDFAEAICGLSTALNSVCDWRGRGGVLLYRGKFDRWHVDEEGMLVDARARAQGSGLTKKVVDIVRKQLEDAATWGFGVLHDRTVSSLAAALQREPSGEALIPKIRLWARSDWEGSRVLRLIERSTRATMRRWYLDRYVSGTNAALGKDSSVYRRPQLPSSLTVPAAPTVLPFHTFTCPLTARDIRMISQRNAHRISCSTLRSPWLPRSVYPPPRPPSPHLKVGYVSSDFNNHPLAHLMQSVFGFHDRTRVEAFCYATTASDKSVHRLQIERESPVFRDVSSWPVDRLVRQIVDDGIHVLVNLNGYTRGARNEVFAARPAPIQMSFMGFAGSLGAEWCDYILADTTAVPPETLRPWRNNLKVEDVFRDRTEECEGDWIYSENIIFCRDTFFCCDHAQSSDSSESRISWKDEQRHRWEMRKHLFPNLPDDTVILGNFNQLYKIDPSTFRSWLRILSHVPRAILWLLRFPELGEANLMRTARAWAGNEVASRIIFTDVAPKDQHISRAGVCDLFLDTPECNAHTTAADVLWSSTPLLTLPRYPYKMCSRIAASVLKGALPKTTDGRRAAEELIASSEEAYEELAVRLASSTKYRKGMDFPEGTGRLAELRKLLWQNKWSCALFDTHRWVADLELAYEEAWRRWVAGESGDIYL